MSGPLHERIRADFEARILAGELAPGDRLPTEQALMAQYGCARMTVSKALSALAAAGLIDRRKRAGTFVARPRVHSMILDVPDLAAQIRERGQHYAYVPLERRIRDPETGNAAETQLAGAGRLIQLDGLHLADNIPLAVEYRLVSLAAVPDIADAGSDDTPPGTWLLRHIPWTEAETRISALAASPAVARLLQVAPGTACLCVERRTWRRAEGVTHVRQIFPGDAYDLVARFGPSGGQEG
ncbi:histidine utilization repressor [Sphingopyxis panaciterrulae]|uniref:Histidine utilization repressor n=1 Tax=Sphingopyxis panaciterrulae TaxID=462372 RepID=A0A7W9B515_9SPHN|nr:histidine utilization repressor [Sphingopyxis panaciterrulae]MBB5705979.1 GntR family histidine utilization transcriptional repressor [Sphingopyxis panaciterrulae]